MIDNSKALYQPWNEEEFRADIYVIAMTPLQRWMYRTLLQAAFFHSTRPYLPVEDKLLWMLAGCENRKQWEENKEPVLDRFTTVQIDGQELLSQKRVLADWNRLLDKRETLVELGRRGGQASAKRTLENREAYAQASKRSEVREESEEKGSEEDLSASTLKPVNLKKELPVLSEKILGVKAEKKHYEIWDDIEILAKAHHSAHIVQAFEEWAEANRGRITKNPIAAFVDVASGILNGIITVRDNPDLERVCQELYQIGSQTFAGQHRVEINLLLKTFTASEILDAYREFVNGKDDFDMKFAAKNFTEGGANSIILAARQRKADEEKSKQIIETERSKAQAEAAANIAKLQEQNEEDEFFK